MKISEKLYAFIWNSPSANNCNTYFIQGSKKILVDPGHHHLFGHVRDQLSRLSLTPGELDVVMITHGHPDHLEGSKIFTGTSTLVALGEIELQFIRTMAPHYAEGLGGSHFEPDILLREGTLHIGDTTFEVIQTPGHSPGSMCLYWPDEKALFTGDVVFNQGLGRTDVPGGSGEQLKESIRGLAGLDVETLLPGHGDIVSGREAVRANFDEIERVWFGY
ncbi:MAG: MBL fold metallo-hydrolase, partial [Pseudomonadota bacterium]